MIAQSILTVLLSVSLSPAFADFPSRKSIKWTGCGISKKAFMSRIGKEFTKETGIKVKLSGGGATKGIRNTQAQKSDVGGSCRHQLTQGRSLIEEENAVELIHVAWDVLVAVVHPSNPLESIRADQFKSIFEGKITNWQQLGGSRQDIRLMTRKGKISGVGMMFRMLAFGDPEYDFQARSMRFKSTGRLEKALEKEPWGIAVDGISSARKRKLKILQIDGLNPLDKKLATSGKYPYFRPLYLAKRRDENRSDVDKLINFILSPRGQQIISAEGTINLAEGKNLSPLFKSKVPHIDL